ncbi:hypothetical protein, partial [Fundidesulfovibrio magnetotacticus]|uniref:hypothetical protein n=1 Tax=Fundidesulfovibrio magnetotacticus TaxID=2730080 RepID=UPI001C258389
MLFKPFGSSLLASAQPEAIQYASGPARGLSGGLWTNHAPPVQAAGPGPVRPGSASGGPFSAPHPDDPGPLENYPFGRPPLTPEQTRRAYARQLGIDPSQIDP